MIRPTPLAWGKPRHEFVLLALVAFAALTPVNVVNTQDISHFCLTRALAAGGSDVDRVRRRDQLVIAFYGGYVYSNKAPGMSVLALPAVEVARLQSAQRWTIGGDLRLWLVRVLTTSSCSCAPFCLGGLLRDSALVAEDLCL